MWPHTVPVELLVCLNARRTLWVWSRVITMGFQNVSEWLVCLAAVPVESLACPGVCRTLWVWSRVITMCFQNVSEWLACLASAHGPNRVVGARKTLWVWSESSRNAGALEFTPWSSHNAYRPLRYRIHVQYLHFPHPSFCKLRIGTPARAGRNCSARSPRLPSP